MRSLWVFYLILLVSFLGCQSLTDKPIVPGGGTGPGNFLNKPDPDPGAAEDTPQTIVISPYMGTPQPRCDREKPLWLCIENPIDPEICPGTSFRFNGSVGSNKPGITAGDIEISIKFPEDTKEISRVISPIPNEDGSGYFRTFITPLPGDVERYFIKVSAYLKANPAQSIVIWYDLPKDMPPDTLCNNIRDCCNLPDVSDVIAPGVTDGGTGTVPEPVNALH